MPSRPSGEGAPRRAPRDEDRGQAAERTREKILDAAVREFGAKGYAGARTAGIAARAGVNQQLIAYYFGGKQGVLDELRRRWAQRQDTLSPPDADYAASLAAHLDRTLDDPDWARLVIWRALGDGPDDESDAAARAEQQARLRQAAERIRHRQRTGELTPDVDAEFVLLLSYLIAFAPIALPHVVTALFGGDPCSSDYRQRSHSQLLALLRPGSTGSGAD